MSDRTFFVRLNLDDMSAEVVGLDSTEERGQWLEGFLVGSRGKDSRDVWHPAKLDGHRFGMVCFQEAENYRGKQSAKGVASGEARRNRTAAEPLLNNGLTAVEPDGNRTPTGPQPIQQPTSNSQHPTTTNEKPDPPKAPQGVSEVMELWNSMAKGNPFPQARLTAERQRTIATRVKEAGWMDDFRAALVFVAGDPFSRGENDRGWIVSIDYLLRPGKAVAAAERGLAPKSATPASSPGSPAGPRPMTPEEKNRLEGHRIDLQQAERDLRIAKNRPYDFDVDEAKRKVDAVRARILKMGKDPDAMMSKKDEPKEFDITLIPKEVLDRL